MPCRVLYSDENLRLLTKKPRPATTPIRRDARDCVAYQLGAGVFDPEREKRHGQFGIGASQRACYCSWVPAGIQLFFQIVFGALFVVVLLSGAYILKNFERFFGADPNIPSEGESSRAYTKAQVFLIWIHALILTGGFALLIH